MRASLDMILPETQRSVMIHVKRGHNTCVVLLSSEPSFPTTHSTQAVLILPPHTFNVVSNYNYYLLYLLSWSMCVVYSFLQRLLQTGNPTLFLREFMTNYNQIWFSALSSQYALVIFGAMRETKVCAILGEKLRYVR